MSHTLMLEVPDEIYQAITQAARTKGQTAETWVVEQLPQVLPSPRTRPDYPELRHRILARDMDWLQRMFPPESLTDEFIDQWVDECIVALPKPRTPEERRAIQEANRRFMQRHFGAVSLGYPTGLDNEQIDADLTREYADNHVGE